MTNARAGAGVTVRFASFPATWLNLSDARLALLSWLLARSSGGRFVLRLDDIDASRSNATYADAITQDLHWLGLDWDASFRQSDRLDRYAAAAERLKAARRLYPCFESEDELQAKRERALRRGAAPIYDRAMLKLTPAQRAAAEAGGKRPYWRFLLSDRTVTWRDLVLGPQQVKLPALSDPVLIRADGTLARAFASVVDDIEEGVTHILHGEDHLSQTAVQIDIREALGNAERLHLAHVPPLLDDAAGKRARRIEGLSLRRLRSDGIEPAAITACLACVGSSANAEPPSTLAAGFDLGRFSSPARFDVDQLRAINRRVLRRMSFSDVADRLPPGATEAFWLAIRGHLDLLTEARGWWEVVAGTIVPPVIEGDAEFLRAATAVLPPEPWHDGVWTAWTEALARTTGRKGEALSTPLCLALTGEDQCPALAGLLPLIGRARSLQRLQAAAQ
jgi:glutamyl-tRNA synthetase